jgi:hypothetical protein
MEPKGPGFGFPQREFAILKFQKSISKSQTNSNNQNSKIQTMSRHGKFWSLNIGICDLFVIWCLEFVILDTKLQARTIYL